MDELEKLDEENFLEWYTTWAKKFNLNLNPYDKQNFYDYKGAYMEGDYPDKHGNWPGKFKKPGHPTFSVDSQYYQPGMEVKVLPKMKVDKQQFDRYLMMAHKAIFDGSEREKIVDEFKKLTGVTMPMEPWTPDSEEGRRDTQKQAW